MSSYLHKAFARLQKGRRDTSCSTTVYFSLFHGCLLAETWITARKTSEDSDYQNCIVYKFGGKTQHHVNSFADDPITANPMPAAKTFKVKL